MADIKKQIKDFNLLTQVVGANDNILLQRDNGTTFRTHVNNLPFTKKDYTTAGLATLVYVNAQDAILNNKIVALQSSSGRVEKSLNNYLLKANYRLHSTAGYATISYVNNAISGISGGSGKDYTTAGLATLVYVNQQDTILNNKIISLQSSSGYVEGRLNNYLLKSNYRLHSTAGYATTVSVNNSLNNYLLKSVYKNYTTAGLATTVLLNTKVSQIYSSQGNYLLKTNYRLHSTAGYATSVYVNAQDTIINNKVVSLQSSSGRVEKSLSTLALANTGDETQSTILTKGVKAFTGVTWVTSTPITIDAYANDKSINSVTGNQLIQYSNLVNGAQLSFVIDKQTASDVTITLPVNTLGASGTAEAIVSLVDTTVLLSGASGGKYLFSVRNVNGILYTQIIKLAAENSLGFIRNIYCSGVQAPWSSIGGATVNTDQVAVSVVIPVGVMGLNSVMEICILTNRPGNTNSTSFKIKEGSNTLFNAFYNSATILAAQNTIHIASKNSLSSQIVSKTNTTNATNQLFTMDFTTQRTLTFCINIGNSADSATAFESISIKIQG